MANSNPHLNLPYRARRLRQSAALRDMVAETTLLPQHLIAPFFLLDGAHRRDAVASMPGVWQQTLDHVLIEIDQGLKLGIKAYMLFGVPEAKDAQGTNAHIQDGLIQHACAEIKKQFGQDVVLMADTCLCEYTSHGHCGLVMDGQVVNDPSVSVLAKIAVSQAEAGADVVCPSDMMDGRIAAIREALDEAGFENTVIMAYAAKYASAFYAPFRDAAASAPSFGDRRSYQMDPRNLKEALRETMQDIDEGADMIMVKPASAYGDVIKATVELVEVPVAAYHVSGEYSMVKAAAANGWIDERAVVLELMTGLRRAGATMVATYHAFDVARWLQSHD
ncbi:MAG: porphobilinogen synthase [Cyanobacteria bacterium HKST-UBA04]|nr:porphobilinogen synthase [Cyanobacteria bacterium HKST-UBA04]MCA9840584.1 porphobilinogen synthase [Cyanobacteria bacterium HKST-UBA03]